MGRHVREGVNVKKHDIHIKPKSYKLDMREGVNVKKHDIHIKPKSYKLELLGELVV